MEREGSIVPVRQGKITWGVHQEDIQFFSMSGGEPLLREDIFDLCDYAHKRGCWLFRAQGMNPCFYPEAKQIYREIADALYFQTNEGKSQVLS